LLAGSLAPGSLDEVTREWVSRVGSSGALVEAGQLYSGRQFRESVQVSIALGATLLIVSAGLGVLRPTDLVPSYGLTVAPGASDGILDRVTEWASAEDWWQAITRHFRSLDATIEDGPARPILIALPSPYLSMIEQEIEQFSPERLSRTRVFTGPSFRFQDARLNRHLMPYDARLDGSDSPSPGTATDFASRALRDFATFVLPAVPEATPEQHAAAVSRRLEPWAAAARPERKRLSDADLLKVVRANWDNAGGSASRMLRRLRCELGVACEQSRIQALHAVVRKEMETAT
jgi:hypothetical protein